jgi:hypothetical protein
MTLVAHWRSRELVFVVLDVRTASSSPLSSSSKGFLAMKGGPRVIRQPFVVDVDKAQSGSNKQKIGILRLL